MKLLVFSLLAICSYTDLRKRVISMRVLLIFLSIYFLWMTFMGLLHLGKSAGLSWVAGYEAAAWLESDFYYRITIENLIMSLLPGIILLIFSKLLKGSVGEGDAYLIILTGLMLGNDMNLRLLMGGLFLSVCFAVFLILARKKDKTTAFPFVPFLFISYILIFIMIPPTFFGKK